MAIPVTYNDGNPEDRAYARDFWAWLERQPQEAWLFYARTTNWDVAEMLFIEMVRHPLCDRALASWLFWSSNPADAIASGTRPGRGTLIGAILEKSEQGGFREARLHYRRVEVALAALHTADTLARLDKPPPLEIPRELCASFEGDNAELAQLDEATRQELEPVFRSLGGWLPRSDSEALVWKRDGGNWWYESALRLPPAPQVRGDMSDTGAIDAVFGEHRAALTRIERERIKRDTGRKAAARRRNQAGAASAAPAANPKQRLIGLALLGAGALGLLGVLVANLAF